MPVVIRKEMRLRHFINRHKSVKMRAVCTAKNTFYYVINTTQT